MSPPDEAYPWVYSFWMEGNITKEGITADLEAMKQAGIRGLLFMDGALGNPVGPHRFMSESWLEMFNHMLAEADRLGIEVNLNNDPGWAGSAGPWINAGAGLAAGHRLPKRFWRGLHILTLHSRGPRASSMIITRILPFWPILCAGQVSAADLSDPGLSHHKVICRRTRFRRRGPVAALYSDESGVAGGDPAEQCVQSAQMQDLTDKLEQRRHAKLGCAGRPLDGSALSDILFLTAPPARRRRKPKVGMSTNSEIRRRGALCGDGGQAGSDNAGALAGKVLVSTHIDSWEAGSGNWTKGFREEFRRRRGYDLLPFLPTLNGMVVDSREVSESFLWDYRETVCQLLLENYAGHFRELAHRRGLRLSIEAYDGTCDDLRYAGRADEPMSEFWRSCYSGLPLSDLNEEMTSAPTFMASRLSAPKPSRPSGAIFSIIPPRSSRWRIGPSAPGSIVSASVSGSCSLGHIWFPASRSAPSEPCSSGH